MTPESHIELDENGKPLVNGFDEFANIFFKPVIAMFFYLSSISIGLFNVEYFIRAPAPRFLSHVFGFISSVISSVNALLIAMFVPDKFDFVKDVFKLYSNKDYSMAIAFVVLFIPLSRPVTRIIDRAFISNKQRKNIFIITSIFVMALFALIYEYVVSLNNPTAYFFSFFITGIIYLIFICHKKEIKTPRMRPRANPLNGNQFNL